MLILRWSSDAARKLYARVGERVQTSLLDSAVDAPLDSVRSHTLIAAEQAGTAATAPTDVERAAAAAVEEARLLLERAQAHEGALPARAELPCAIDDHAAARAVRAAGDALVATAARADEALGRTAAGDASDSDDDV